MTFDFVLKHDGTRSNYFRIHAIAIRSGRRYVPAAVRIDSRPQLTVIRVAAMVPLTSTPVKTPFTS
jgi:hypothetical protein